MYLVFRIVLHMRISSGTWEFLLRISSGTWELLFAHENFFWPLDESFLTAELLAVFKLSFYCFMKGSFTVYSPHSSAFFVAALFSMPFFSLPIFMSEPYSATTPLIVRHTSQCQCHPSHIYVYLFNRDSSNSAILDGFCLANTICICRATFRAMLLGYVL